MPYETEWQTRKKRIDSRLEALGWAIRPYSDTLHLGTLTATAVEELPTKNGPADYGLFVGGQLLGIIEAKKVTVNPQNVLEQAKRYAAGVHQPAGNWDGLRVPFLYATNGTIIWHLDARQAKRVSRSLSDFHTPDAMSGLFTQDLRSAADWLRKTPPEQIERLRPYQRDCILAVEEQILSGRRKMLVAMATGTGKTFLTVAQIYRILESKLAQRILFLVDRKALAAQAVREFNAFNTPNGHKFSQEYEVYSQRFQKEDFGDDTPFNPKVLPNEYLTAPKSSHTFVYVSTIQRMARNLFGAEAVIPGSTRNPGNSDGPWIPDDYLGNDGTVHKVVIPGVTRNPGNSDGPWIPDDYLGNDGTVHKAVIPGVTRNPEDRDISWIPDDYLGNDGTGRRDRDYDDEGDKLDIPIHAFDLIIADECHRGYTMQETSIWRDTIQHFDAVKIGLTATPAAHTVALFHEPVYRYGVEQAIREGFLVDYEAVAIKSDVLLNGVFLKEGEEVGVIDTQTGEEVYDQVEDEREFSAGDVERKITAPDCCHKVLQEIAKHAYAHEEATGHFPKILIFAVNDIPHTSHADQIVRTCREIFNQGDEFVQKITGNPNVDRPLQKIREFRNRPNPKIVVTVDMLSTGVDIPALEFIVFMRPVKSRILWEQMLGRGTRLCRDIGKTKFVIFDCFDGTLIRYFKDVSNFKIETPKRDPLTIPQVIDNIWQNVDRPYNINVLVKRLRRIEKDMSGEARTQFAAWIPDGDIGVWAGQLPQRLQDDFTGTMNLLRNPTFQQLLMFYPRAKRSFWITYDTKDEVTSYAMERYGKYNSAEDYLVAFSTFIKENEDQIAAIKILLDRPKDWKPQALDQLRKALQQHSFDEKHLRQAHGTVYRKDLADIISMVKHAARSEERILTAPERVEVAMARIRLSHTFTKEQLLWLGFIEQHLIENLSIDTTDLETQPIFDARGGIGRAKILFGNQLPLLIEELNLAVAVAA